VIVTTCTTKQQRSRSGTDCFDITSKWQQQRQEQFKHRMRCTTFWFSAQDTQFPSASNKKR